MSTLLSVSIAILAGLLMTRVFKPLKLPAVTAYLIAGVLVGPYCLGALHIGGLGFTTEAAVSNLELVSEIALGFIAFTIGNEFRLSTIKKTGMQSIVVALFEGLTACAFVEIALIGVHFMLPDKLSLPQAITLGAIATATAPAATLMVVRQYKAKGPLTTLLLQVVALDDAVALIAFAVAFGIAKTIANGEMDLVAIILNPIIEIALSLALGAFMGWVLTQIEKIFNSHTNRLNMSIAFVFLTVSLTMVEFQVGPVTIGFSSLLTCMMLGTVFCNLCPLSEDIMAMVDRWTSPVFALFFVISGAGLELSVFSDITIVLIGIVYIVIRCLGKYTGARVSSKMMKCPPQTQKYLGITLFPQAGVALGMCTLAMQLGEQGALIRNITLFGILVYELAGPLLTKISLTKAGEITPMAEEVKNRRKNRLAEVTGQK